MLWMHPAEPFGWYGGTFLLSLFSLLLRSPTLHETKYLIPDLQGQPAPATSSSSLHSQKVPVHNQDVYCFEWVSFPSALFLLATESSWEAFDGPVMNLKVVLKTLLQLLFCQPNRLDSAGICHRERLLSPHLAVSWESHSNFGGWALRGQKWPLVQKLCKEVIHCTLQMQSRLPWLLSAKRKIPEFVCNLWEEENSRGKAWRDKMKEDEEETTTTTAKCPRFSVHPCQPQYRTFQ